MMRLLLLNITATVVSVVSVAHWLAKHLVLVMSIASTEVVITLSTVPAKLMMSFVVETYLRSTFGHHVIGPLWVSRIVVHVRGVASGGSISLVAKLLPALVSLVLSMLGTAHSALSTERSLSLLEFSAIPLVSTAAILLLLI